MAYAERPAAVATVTADERGIILETDYAYAFQGSTRALLSSASVFLDFFRRRWRHRRNTGATVRGSWDGVLCIERGIWKGREMRYQIEQYVLWNPVTLAYATVDPPPPVDSGQIIGAYAHPTTRGFHLVHVSGEDVTDELMSMKTFRILRIGDTDAAMTWREIPLLSLKEEEESSTNDAQTSKMSRNARSVGLRGNLHWPVLSSSGTLRLLAFDTARDTFQSIEAPPTEHRRGPADLTMVRLSTLSGGKLCIFFVEPSTSSMDLWLLDDYRATVTRSSWRLKERISLVTLACEYCDWYDLPRMLDASIEVEVVEGVGEGEAEEIFLHHSRHIAVYNVGCKAWRRTVHVAPWAGKPSHVSLAMHRESEVSFGQASRAVSHKVGYDGKHRYCV
ncbi:hypothetical protein ACQ4PT_021481 [Festuca glaucescens]